LDDAGFDGKLFPMKPGENFYKTITNRVSVWNCEIFFDSRFGFGFNWKCLGEKFKKELSGE
jgi:hypothetical protein